MFTGFFNSAFHYPTLKEASMKLKFAVSKIWGWLKQQLRDALKFTRNFDDWDHRFVIH
jgi:hypothetical protein